jgi:hypothetical protein
MEGKFAKGRVRMIWGRVTHFDFDAQRNKEWRTNTLFQGYWDVCVDVLKRSVTQYHLVYFYMEVGRNSFISCVSFQCWSTCTNSTGVWELSSVVLTKYVSISQRTGSVLLLVVTDLALGLAISVSEVERIRRCIQKFPDWPPGARTANCTALCH